MQTNELIGLLLAASGDLQTEVKVSQRGTGPGLIRMADIQGIEQVGDELVIVVTPVR